MFVKVNIYKKLVYYKRKVIYVIFLIFNYLYFLIKLLFRIRIFVLLSIIFVKYLDIIMGFKDYKLYNKG